MFDASEVSSALPDKGNRDQVYRITEKVASTNTPLVPQSARDACSPVSNLTLKFRILHPMMLKSISEKLRTPRDSSSRELIRCFCFLWQIERRRGSRLRSVPSGISTLFHLQKLRCSLKSADAFRQTPVLDPWNRTAKNISIPLFSQ